MRGTLAFGETRGLHLLAAYLPGVGVVLFQVAVDTQTNEIRAAPQVLKMLDLQGKIVSGDATLAPALQVQVCLPSGRCRC